MSRFTEADIVVVGLIGERGREVGNFVQMVMTPEARGKTVIVAVPADRSPLLRIAVPNVQPRLPNISAIREKMFC